jgi:hypothetical protein
MALGAEKPLDKLKNFIKKFKKDYEVIERLWIM